MKKRMAKLVTLISLSFNMLFIVGFSVAFFAGATTARDSRPGPVTEDSNRPWWADSRLDLSESQQSAFQDTDAQLFDRINEIKEHTSEHCQELFTLISREDVAMAQIEPVIDEIGMLQNQAQKSVMQSILDKRDVLSGGQKQKFLDLLEERMSRHGCLRRGWHGGRRYRGGRDSPSYE